MPSGRFGLVNRDTVPGTDVTAVSTVENWNLTDTKSADSYVASNTYGGTMRAGGIRSWSGSFAGKGGTPPILPNDIFEFRGYTAPATGIEGTPGTVYSGPAICSSVSIVWNWATNTILMWTAEFSGWPGLDIVVDSVVEDVSLPPLEATCGTKIVVVDGDETEIPFLVSATLTITANQSVEANSSTIGADGICYTKTNAGPIDWTLAMPQEDYERETSNPNGSPELGSIVALKAYTNDTDAWILNFGRVMDYSNLTIDRSTGAIINRTLNVSMCAANETTVGQIVVPGGDLLIRIGGHGNAINKCQLMTSHFRSVLTPQIYSAT